jgi:hypothetical protein
MRIVEKNGSQVIFFIVTFNESELEPVLFRNNYKTLEIIDKKCGNEDGNQLFEDSKSRIRDENKKELYLVFVKKNSVEDSLIQVQINKDGNFEFDNSINNSSFLSTLEIGKNKDLSYCFDSSQFSKYFEFSNLISSSERTPYDSNPNCYKIKVPHASAISKIEEKENLKDIIYDLDVLFRKKIPYSVTQLEKNVLMINQGEIGYSKKIFGIKGGNLFEDNLPVESEANYKILEELINDYISENTSNDLIKSIKQSENALDNLFEGKLESVRSKTDAFMRIDTSTDDIVDLNNSEFMTFHDELSDFNSQGCELTASIIGESVNEQRKLISQIRSGLLFTLIPEISLSKQNDLTSGQNNSSENLDHRINALKNLMIEIGSIDVKQEINLNKVIDTIQADEEVIDTSKPDNKEKSSKMKCTEFKKIFKFLFSDGENPKKNQKFLSTWKENLLRYLDERHWVMSQIKTMKLNLSIQNCIFLAKFAYSYLKLTQIRVEDGERSDDINSMIIWSFAKQIKNIKSTGNDPDLNHAKFTLLREKVASIPQNKSLLGFSSSDWQTFLEVFTYAINKKITPNTVSKYFSIFEYFGPFGSERTRYSFFKIIDEKEKNSIYISAENQYLLNFTKKFIKVVTPLREITLEENQDSQITIRTEDKGRNILFKEVKAEDQNKLICLKLNLPESRKNGKNLI